MTFKELMDIARNMIDETDIDEQIDIIIKSAINKSYADLCKKDSRLKRAYLPIVNGIATLPEDCISIVTTIPELEPNDQTIGNSIITNKDGVIELLYSYVREPLILDTDEPDLHITLQYAMSTYACYRYWQYRKKVDVANLHYNNYVNELMVFSNEHELSCFNETVRIV